MKSLKARLFADGCGQLLGVDYHETYAATASPEIERLLLMYAASKNFEVNRRGYGPGLNINLSTMNSALQLRLLKDFGIKELTSFQQKVT